MAGDGVMLGNVAIVKVCGITNQQDADAAIAGGATAIGFNFYPSSPRYIGPETAAAIHSAPGVVRVGVFVNETRARIEEIARIASLAAAQLHGDEMPADYPAALAVWKAARVGTDFRFSEYELLPAHALLLDGPAAELYGGSGKSFDWSILKVHLAGQTAKRVILAGGLDASNVAQAVAMAHPWGVDACSRIEISPGKKDYAKMNEFLQAARAALGI